MHCDSHITQKTPKIALKQHSVNLHNEKPDFPHNYVKPVCRLTEIFFFEKESF